jgi:hypothetical protein
MKRLALAMTVVALTAACKKAEQTPPPADTTTAPAAAPAPAMDSARMADSAKMRADTSKGMRRDTTKMNPSKKPS